MLIVINKHILLSIVILNVAIVSAMAPIKTLQYWPWVNATSKYIYCYYLIHLYVVATNYNTHQTIELCASDIYDIYLVLKK
jgi:hypothetical protein